MLKNVCKKSAKVKCGELFFMLSSNRQNSINLPRSTLLPHLNLLIINIDYLKPGVVTKTLFRSNKKDRSFYDEQTCRWTQQHNTSAWSAGPPNTALPVTDLLPGKCSTPTNFPKWQSGRLLFCSEFREHRSSPLKTQGTDSGHLRSSGLMLQKTETEAI